ncbi:MAG: tetratricopeptide repeat protein [Bacteroidales bacterium]|jgi:tetratricopeptide (TPR) repeat protein|nr:tetratricopeptide repeat protein [Bacteroidales bacterium]
MRLINGKQKSGACKVVALVAFFAFFASCKTAQTPPEQIPYTKERLEIDDLLLQGITQSDVGNNREAERLYNAVLERDPENAVAYSKLCLIAFAEQDWAKAEVYADKAITLSPDNIWYRLQLGQMYYIMQRYAKSAEVYEQIIKLNPDKIEFYQTLTDIYLRSEEYNKALGVLDRMEHRWGVSEEISMTKYNIYNMMNKQDKADNEIAKLAVRYPEDTKYNSILAESAMKAKDYAKAFSYYQKVEKIDPDNPYLQVALADYYLKQKNKTLGYDYLMRAAKNKGLDANTKIQVIISVYGQGVDTNREDFERFFALLQEIDKANPNNGKVKALLATGYLRDNYFSQASYLLKQAIECGEKGFNVYQDLLFAQSAASNDDANLDSVITIADSAISLYPEQPLPYLFKGVNLMLKKIYPQAIETLSKGRQLVFNNNSMLTDFYYNLAETYYRQQAYDSSDYYFEKTIASDSGQYMAMNNYAYYLSLRNTKLDRAEAIAEKVVARFPDNHIYVDTYAWILYQQKRYEEAKQAMEKILKYKDSWSQTEQEHYQTILDALKTKQ